MNRLALTPICFVTERLLSWLWQFRFALLIGGVLCGGTEPIRSDETHPANPFLPEGAPDVGWPFLRGPNFDGHSAEVRLAEAWPEEGPPVVWARDLGQGYSALVVVEDRVFTQYQTVSGQYVICLSADSGKTLWQHRYDWAYELTGLYPGPRSTPTVANRQVYYATPTGVVGCLNWQGRELWTVDLYERFGGEWPGFGYACSPVVVDQRVLMPVGSAGASMVALDARTGATIWQAGDDPSSYTPALPITIVGRRQVVGYLENTLVGHDLLDGRQLWRLRMSQGYDEHAAWPIYVEPWLWISGPFQSGSRMFRVPSTEAGELEEVWSSKILSNDVCSSVHHAGYLYGFDLRDVQSKPFRPSRGQFRCLEFATGEEQWSTDEVGHASVLVADGKLILFNDRGELILARALPEEYTELARATVLGEEICWTPPALHRGRVYLRDHARAVCLYLGEPELLEPAAAQSTQRLADIPVGSTSWNISRLLGVDPATAHEFPSHERLWRWYLAGLGILVMAEVFALLCVGALRIVRRQSSVAVARTVLFRTAALLGGVVGTTLLSRWQHEFLFTWPLVLCVLFQMTIDQAQAGSSAEGPRQTWYGRLVLGLFFAGGVGYYLICQRLGLATQWAFLCGFAGALPFSLARRAWQRKRGSGPLGELLFSGAEWSGFYAAAVAILLWRS